MVGRYGEVVLMDWGVAKVLRADSANAATPEAEASKAAGKGNAFATQEGTLLGTPAYMAPEQVQGRHREIDHRSDIYSATVLFHELLAVRYYLDHCQNSQKVMMAILMEKMTYMRLAFLRHPKHQVPSAELLHFMVKGLSKDPEDRFQSIPEMIDELQRIRDGRCRVSCPATLAKRMTNSLGRFVNRYPKLSPFIFYSMLLLLIISMITSIRLLLVQLPPNLLAK